MAEWKEVSSYYAKGKKNGRVSPIVYLGGSIHSTKRKGSKTSNSWRLYLSKDLMKDMVWRLGDRIDIYMRETAPHVCKLVLNPDGRYTISKENAQVKTRYLIASTFTQKMLDIYKPNTSLTEYPIVTAKENEVVFELPTNGWEKV